MIKLTDNSTVDCFDTRAEAEAQVRALYANEGEKGRRSEQLTGTSEIDYRNHLHLRHGSQARWAAIESANLTELVAMHAAMHPDGDLSLTSPATGNDMSMVEKSLSPNAVKMLAEFDAEQHGTKAVTDQEREDHERFLQANEALLGGLIPSPAEEAAREASRREVEDQERERLSNERDQARANGLAANDSSRDNRGWRQGTNGVDYYTERLGVTEPVTDTPRRTYPEPIVHDGTVKGLGESIGVLQPGYINEEDARLIRQSHPDRPVWTPYGDLVIDDPIPDKSIPGEGETVRVNPGQRANENRRIEKEGDK